MFDGMIRHQMICYRRGFSEFNMNHKILYLYHDNQKVIIDIRRGLYQDNNNLFELTGRYKSNLKKKEIIAI